MQLQAVLSKANTILNKILNYLQRRRKMRLYQQWVEKDGLPPEAIPQEDSAEDITPKIEKERPHLPILYMLLGGAFIIFCVGLILLIAQSC